MCSQWNNTYFGKFADYNLKAWVVFFKNSVFLHFVYKRKNTPTLALISFSMAQCFMCNSINFTVTVKLIFTKLTHLCRSSLVSLKTSRFCEYMWAVKHHVNSYPLSAMWDCEQPFIGGTRQHDLVLLICTLVFPVRDCDSRHFLMQALLLRDLLMKQTRMQVGRIHHKRLKSGPTTGN